MQRTLLTALTLLLLLTITPAAEEENDPKKKFLIGIGAAFQSGKAGSISSHFPETKKVELRLRGVKSGRYRSSQAKSLLSTYLGRTIQPIKYKLKEVRGAIGKFTSEYRVRADGTKVKCTTCVYLEEKDGGFLIVGIVEY